MTSGQTSEADSGQPEARSVDVSALARDVALLATRAGADGAAELVRQAVRRAGAPTARICVVGGTNVGKSRLVNELAGADCVPVSVLPSSGRPVLVTAGGEPGEAASGRVEVVVPRLPADAWMVRSGMELVDTPGWEAWSGTREPDSEALARIVADCDAVVVVTEARRALLATEQARIRALAEAPHSPPLLLVVSKLDEVGSEAAQIMKRVRHLVGLLAPHASALAAPVPVTPGAEAASRDAVELCRAVLTALAGAQERAALRTARRLRLLAAVCDLVVEAAGRAVAAGADGESDTYEDRVAEIWQARHTAARFRWIVLAGEVQERRRELADSIAAEGRRRRTELVRTLSERLSGMLETPEEQLFVRLHVVPVTEQAMEEFTAWATGTVDEALRRDTATLREALRRNRSGGQDAEDAALDTQHALPAPRLPRVAGTAASTEAEDAAGWDASWVPDFVGSALDSVVSPFATDAVGGVVGAAATALTTELLEHGQAERRQRAIEALGGIAERAFTEQSQLLGARLTEIYERLLASARDRDEQWWRLHTAAASSVPESLDHWRGLDERARSLALAVRERVRASEGEPWSRN
ncbi:GTPase [Streptomyces niveus]|uniref:GTPase n=1 Tax=Streptomyces niveus TaxID=193462 RepID=UPI0033C2B457